MKTEKFPSFWKSKDETQYIKRFDDTRGYTICIAGNAYSSNFGSRELMDRRLSGFIEITEDEFDQVRRN